MATHPTAPHEQLRAWQACYRLALDLYKISAAWPREERFGLTAQVRSAAYSAGANIAEGMAREGSRELHRFLSMAVGSLAELEFALRLARDLGFLTHEAWEGVESARADAGRLTGALAKSVRRTRTAKPRA